MHDAFQRNSLPKPLTSLPIMAFTNRRQINIKTKIYIGTIFLNFCYYLSSCESSSACESHDNICYVKGNGKGLTPASIMPYNCLWLYSHTIIQVYNEINKPHSHRLALGKPSTVGAVNYSHKHAKSREK